MKLPGRALYGDGQIINEPTPTKPKPEEDITDITSQNTVVAFTAKLQVHHSYPKHEGVLRFTDVLINKGGGYSPDTGIFTCPQPGFYHFTAHMSTYGKAQCGIFKNEKSVVSMYHSTLPNKLSQMASISSVIQLLPGDKVWVNLWVPCRNDIQCPPKVLEQ
ncbi:DNA-directed RNA polymerase II subunit RPB9 isoform X2 [Hypomesus transpacificus]|uniref:DNA-directed RNA polymerase II subunit RPB9 isoform X2 n=1 Tax=Hypomesus transpacificus TaxID=137520 RepID=UPI001F086DE0|nr:DNA-directed RNA polymerase II subunit RPB9 isoform X2 [Hypomesus transpacificus]